MLQIASIVIECAIVVLALMIATTRRKPYGFALALTFTIYVLFDSARQFQLSIPDEFLHVLFLAASVSALWAVWRIYSEVR